MIEVKAPNPWDHLGTMTVFLAGSIEMGAAEPWQSKLIAELENFPITFLNPRRDDWDSSWVQSIHNEQFNEQVNWELKGLENANHVIFYFDPATQSPITLLELGFLAGGNWAMKKSPNVTVCCPEGYWRRGNIEVVCDRYGFSLCSNIEELIYKLKKVYKIWALNYG